MRLYLYLYTYTYIEIDYFLDIHMCMCSNIKLASRQVALEEADGGRAAQWLVH